MYKNYVFDLYGTLVDIHTDEEIDSLWEKLSIFFASYNAKYTPNELKEEYKKFCKEEKEKVQKKHKVTHGEIKVEAVFQRLFNEKSVEVSTQELLCVAKFFRLLSMEYIKLYDGALELLDSLKAKGKKIILLSNAQRSFTESELKFLDLYDRFDKIYISSDYNCCKPDINFYQIMLKELNLNPKETIMIGNDEITDIKGSFEAGLDSLYIHSNISPEIKGELLSKFTIMDGDVKSILPKICKWINYY